MPRTPSYRAGASRVLSLALLAGLLGLLAEPGGFLTFLRSGAQAATTFTVNSTGDAPDANLNDGACNDGAGNCTLRAAIQQANATAGADTINFSVTGTINLTGALPNLTSLITINGPGAGQLTVRRDTGGIYRIFTVASTATVTISGLTVSNGMTADGTPGSPFGNQGAGGGGVSNAGTLTLAGCVITGNATGNGGGGSGGTSNGFGGSGGPGGGVFNTGTLTMTDCTVASNRTGNGGGGGYAGGGGSGGGVSNYQGTLTLTDCVVSDNMTGTGSTGSNPGASGGGGGGGGGIDNHNGTLRVINTIVRNNVTGSGTSNGGSGGGGGGIYSGSSSTVTTTSVLTNVVVRDNRTGDAAPSGFAGQGGAGGGIYNGSSGRMTVNGLTVSGNVAGMSPTSGNSGVGGGVVNSGTLNAVNATISGNSTTGSGGAGAGLWNAGTSSLTNCTIAFNSSGTSYGGAGVHVYNDFYSVSLRNTIVARNSQPGVTNGWDVSGPNITSQGHNLIGNADGTSAFNAPGDQAGRSAAPLDPRLAPLADNGGPTFTHALLAGSPALDAGSNSLAKDASGTPLATDQRGVGRFANPNPFLFTVDIGAYEFHSLLEPVNQTTIPEDTPLAINFAVGDGPRVISSVTASSDNQGLVPDANISVGGTRPVRTLRLTPAANQAGTAQITLTVSYADGGTARHPFTLIVRSVNDMPAFTKGADQTVAEDSGPQTVSGWATGISPGPPDESSQAVSFLVTGNTNPGLFTAAPAVSPSGTLAFTPAPDAHGSATVTLVLKDDGGTANGGQDTSAAQTFTITVTPVNDPPVADSQAVTTSEDSSRFITLTGSDVDGDALTFVVVTGPSNGTLSGSGVGRTYTPALNFHGSDSFTFKAVDPAGAESAPATVSITVTPVNDPPVNTVPGPQTADRNTPLVFSAANGNAVSVADVDAGTNPVRVSLLASRGTLTLATIAGLSIHLGTGGNVAEMVFVGSLVHVNAALDGLTFKPEANYTGPATLRITSDDQGFSGAGGSRGAQNFVSIFVRPGSIEFSHSAYTAREGIGALTVSVRRLGDTSQPAAVDYATDDGSIGSVLVPCSTTAGMALDRCDYTKALGRLSFAAGEAEKSFHVLLADDSYVEGTETALLRLSNPSVGSVLGQRTTATLEITDDALEAPANPIDDSARFVRQHYHDFLNREPDEGGLRFWTNEIESCGADAGCREAKRINVSAAFFLSIEFQETGYLIYRLNLAAFGNLPGKPTPMTLAEFLLDTQRIGLGVVVGTEGWQQQLASNKQAFTNEFVARPRFGNRHLNSATPEQYVEALNANGGGVLSQGEHDTLVGELKSGSKTRAQVLRAVAEHPTLVRRESNRAFVLMQYFGYLRRNPDDVGFDGRLDPNFEGYNFWLSKLNQFGGDFVQAEMVKAFILSIEYRNRFGR